MTVLILSNDYGDKWVEAVYYYGAEAAAEGERQLFDPDTGVEWFETAEAELR